MSEEQKSKRVVEKVANILERKLSESSFLNSSRCLCGLVDVLVGVRIVAVFAMIGLLFAPVVTWIVVIDTSACIGMGVLETIGYLAILYSGVSAFRAVSQRKCALMANFTCAMFGAAFGCLLIAIFSFVPFLRLNSAVPTEIYLQLGCGATAATMLFSWIVLIAINAQVLLKDMAREDEAKMDKENVV